MEMLMVIIGVVATFVGLDLAAIKWGKNPWPRGVEPRTNYDPRSSWKGGD